MQRAQSPVRSRQLATTNTKLHSNTVSVTSHDPRLERSAYRLFPAPASVVARKPSPPVSRTGTTTVERSRRSMSLDESRKHKMLPTPSHLQQTATSYTARSQDTSQSFVGPGPSDDQRHSRSVSAPSSALLQSLKPATGSGTPETAQLTRVQQVQRLLARQQPASQQNSPGSHERPSPMQQVDKLQATAGHAAPPLQRPIGPAMQNSGRPGSPLRRQDSPSSAISHRDPVGLGLFFGSNATTPDLTMFPVPGHNTARSQSPHGYPFPRPHSPHGGPVPQPHSPHGGRLLRPSSPQRQYGINPGSPHHLANEYPRPPPGSQPQQAQSPKLEPRADSPIYTPPGLSAKRKLDHNLRVDTTISSPQRLPQRPLHVSDQQARPPPRHDSQTLQPQQGKKVIRKSTLQKPLPAPPPIESLMPPAPPAELSDASRDSSREQSPVSTPSPISSISPISPINIFQDLNGHLNRTSRGGPTIGSPVSAMTTIDYDVPPQVPLDAPSVPPIPTSISRKPVPRTTPTSTEPATPLTPPSSKFQIKAKSPPRKDSLKSISISPVEGHKSPPTSPDNHRTSSPEVPTDQSKSDAKSPDSTAESPQPSESPVRVEKARSIVIQPLERPKIEQGVQSHKKAPSVALAPSLITLSEQSEVSEQAVSDAAEGAALVLNVTGLPSPRPAPETMSARSGDTHYKASSVASVPSLFTLAERPDEYDVKGAVARGIPRPDSDAMGGAPSMMLTKQPKLADLEHELLLEDAKKGTQWTPAGNPANYVTTLGTRGSDMERALPPRRPTIESNSSPSSPLRHMLDGSSQDVSPRRPTVEGSVQSARRPTLESLVRQSMSDPSIQQDLLVGESTKPSTKSATPEQERQYLQGSSSTTEHSSTTISKRPPIEGGADGSSYESPTVDSRDDLTAKHLSSQKQADSGVSSPRRVQNISFDLPALFSRQTTDANQQIDSQNRSLLNVDAPLGQPRSDKLPSYKSFFMQHDSAEDPLIPTFANASPPDRQQTATARDFVIASKPEFLRSNEALRPLLTGSERHGSLQSIQEVTAKTELAEEQEAQASAQRQQAATQSKGSPPISKKAGQTSAATTQQGQEPLLISRQTPEAQPSEGGVPRNKEETTSTSSATTDDLNSRAQQKQSPRRYSPELSGHPVSRDDETSRQYSHLRQEQTQLSTTTPAPGLSSPYVAYKPGTSSEPTARSTNLERPSGSNPLDSQTHSALNATSGTPPSRTSPSQESQPDFNSIDAAQARQGDPRGDRELWLPELLPARHVTPVVGLNSERISVPRTARTPNLRPNSTVPPPVPRKDTIKAGMKRIINTHAARNASSSSIQPEPVGGELKATTNAGISRGDSNGSTLSSSAHSPSEPSSNAELARQLSEASTMSTSIDAIRARVAGISQRTAKAVEAPGKDEESLLATLEDLGQQSEALHQRYAGMRVERQKLSSSITTSLRENKAGPQYTTTLLDKHMALSAITSSMDICFAKLKSLDCRKEEAISALVLQVRRKTSSASTRTKKPSTSGPVDQKSATIKKLPETDKAKIARVPVGRRETSPKAAKEQSALETGREKMPEQHDRNDSSKQAVQKPQLETVPDADRTKTILAASPAVRAPNGVTHMERSNAASENNAHLVVSMGTMKNSKTPPPQRPLPAPPARRKSLVDSVQASVLSMASTPEDQDVETPAEEETTPNALKGSFGKDVRLYADDDFLDYYRNAP